MPVWSKLPKWGQWLAGTVAGVTAMVTLYAYAEDIVDPMFVSEKQLEELKAHHDEDVVQIITELAAQKKADRIQRNHRELARLQRALVGENYANEAERQFILQEINRLQIALACDEEGIC
jgi:hypothetical protein